MVFITFMGDTVGSQVENAWADLNGRESKEEWA